MARTNKKGSSWHRLELEKEEEERIVKYLKKKDISGFQFLRALVRKYLKDFKKEIDEELAS